MNNLKIGILGGMGPRATARFESKLIAKLSGGDQSMPSIITLNNGNIPDRSSFLLGQGIDPLDTLVNEARVLQSSQVSVVCMPCNTAHSSKILARLMAVVPLPIIDMPSACMLNIEAQGHKTALILGTEGTKREKLFDQRCTTCKCIYPDEVDQKVVSKLINNIKQAKSQDKEIEKLNSICRKYKADVIILACTELSLLKKDSLTDFKVIDSTDILIDSCIEILSNIKKG